MDVFCVSSFVWSSPLRLSLVSVAFDFNPSPNDAAPVSPILLSIDETKREKKCFVDGCLLRVFCLLSSPHRLSFVSVVFDFKASLNDAAPANLILFSVDVTKKIKVLC